MEILVDGNSYEVRLYDNALAKSIVGMSPFALTMGRSAEHEYYASLPQNPDISSAESTISVKGGGIYYFKDWNALALNFKDMDISPYRVYVVGEMEKDAVEYLRAAGNKIKLEV